MNFTGKYTTNFKRLFSEGLKTSRYPSWSCLASNKPTFIFQAILITNDTHSARKCDLILKKLRKVKDFCDILVVDMEDVRFLSR